MGEEMAGLAAVENAWRRIAAGQADLVLVGGALNAEREDLLLGYELGHNVWRGPYAPLWERREEGGGFIPGSVGAFLVLEARAHAEARGANAYAQISDIATDRCSRSAGEAMRSMIELFERVSAKSLPGPLPIFSGASGVEPVTSEEIAFFDYLTTRAIEPVVRGYGSEVGHGVEAHFPAGIALAALALRYGRLPDAHNGSAIERPSPGTIERALLTCVGHWRGEGLALIEAAL
jgi:3-oxoacyl-[acyl-carrier-protein] synthase II